MTHAGLSYVNLGSRVVDHIKVPIWILAYGRLLIVEGN